LISFIQLRIDHKVKMTTVSCSNSVTAVEEESANTWGKYCRIQIVKYKDHDTKCVDLIKLAAKKSLSFQVLCVSCVQTGNVCGEPAQRLHSKCGFCSHGVH
jgi:hypothetical protein